jgi:hypothetical protein
MLNYFNTYGSIETMQGDLNMLNPNIPGWHLTKFIPINREETIMRNNSGLLKTSQRLSHEELPMTLENRKPDPRPSHLSTPTLYLMTTATRFPLAILTFPHQKSPSRIPFM